MALEITDERIKDLKLPVGADANASILTNHNHILALVRGIIMRIHSWVGWFFSQASRKLPKKKPVRLSTKRNDHCRDEGSYSHHHRADQDGLHACISSPSVTA